ncbi:putative tubulin polyglutamylase ttll2, partial [Nowakowskiella sp. JEL0078]
MRGIYGSCYDFYPLTFSVPNEYLKFVKAFGDEEETLKKSVWICKPADLSRGRGIFVLEKLCDLTYDCSAIVQRYIANPMLISGYKYDLRCYVVVRSYHPLIVYLYDEGLARFATNLYDMKDLSNKFSHLTNTSINMLSPSLNDLKAQV